MLNNPIFNPRGDRVSWLLGESLKVEDLPHHREAFTRL
jgi:hypothetical protein